MKKILFLMIGLNFSLSAVCQQTITISDSVTFTLAKGTRQVNISQAQDQEKRKFGNSLFASIVNSEDKNIYLIDDILISLSFRNTGEDLEDRKRGTDGFYTKKGNPLHHNSSLVTINHNKVMIMDDMINHKIGSYIFYCCNSSNTSELIGVLQFDVADKSKATVILNELLNNIKFTK